jgi:hypothetical protein
MARLLALVRVWFRKLAGGIAVSVLVVGINTGEAVVGTLGSRQRLEYAAIGDTINLGARLEGITKDYGASIISSESTHEYVKGQFLTRELGEVTVKGKTQPVKIYAVLPEDIRKYPRRAGARHQPRRLCGEGLAGGVGEGQDDRDPVRRRWIDETHQGGGLDRLVSRRHRGNRVHVARARGGVGRGRLRLVPHELSGRNGEP